MRAWQSRLVWPRLSAPHGYKQGIGVLLQIPRQNAREAAHTGAFQIDHPELRLHLGQQFVAGLHQDKFDTVPSRANSRARTRRIRLTPPPRRSGRRMEKVCSGSIVDSFNSLQCIKSGRSDHSRKDCFQISIACCIINQTKLRCYAIFFQIFSIE